MRAGGRGAGVACSVVYCLFLSSPVEATKYLFTKSNLSQGQLYHIWYGTHILCIVLMEFLNVSSFYVSGSHTGI